jgi:hypothetical protein
MVHGNVLAGNEFVSGGGTTIQGTASALALGNVVNNSMGGSTTFDLTNLPPTFDPHSSGGSGGSSSSSSSSNGSPVSVAWAHYL